MQIFTLPQRSFNIFSMFLVLFLSLAITSAVSAQENDPPENSAIEIKVDAAYDGYYKSPGWFPVQVTITNSGPAVDGTLSVALGPRVVTRTEFPISLANQAAKRVQLPIHGEGTSLIVQLLDENGREIARGGGVVLRPVHSVDALLHAVVTQQPDALEDLEKVSGSRATATLAFLTLEEIPTDASLMRQLDTLIFHDVDTNELSAGQRQAISEWVELGGVLVLTGGAGWQKTTGAFRDVLPVTPTGAQSVEDLPDLAVNIGRAFRDPGPYLITESTLSAGELIYRQDSTPILARRPIGRGSVFFLALDPQFAPLDDWDGSLTIWDKVSEFVPQDFFWETGFQDEREAINALEALPSLTLPSTMLLIIFMAGYILVIGPLNYFILSRMDRMELAWATIPATIVVFSLMAFIIGLQFKGNTPLINEMSIVTGRIGDNVANLDAGVGVYSPRQQSYDIVFDSESLVRPLVSFSSAIDAEDLVVSQEASTYLRDVLIDVSGVGSFAIADTVPLPAISGSVNLRPEENVLRAEVTVTNNLDVPLESAIYLIGNRETTIGDLAPGESDTRIINVPGTVRSPMLEASSGSFVQARRNATGTGGGYVPSPLENHYNALLDGGDYYYERETYPRYQLLESTFANYADVPAWQPNGVVMFIGWSTESQVNIDLDGRTADKDATTVYFLELPFEN